MPIFKSEDSSGESGGRGGGRESVIFSRGWREGEKRTFNPPELFASLKALCTHDLQVLWLQGLQCYKTKMQTGYKKAPSWQHMKLGNSFTLPVVI